MSFAFTLGCLLEVNPLQTWRYVRNGFTLPGYELGSACRPDEYATIPDYTSGPFSTPQLDGAWWVDPGRPELTAFGGWWVDGLTIERDVSRDWRVIQGIRPSARAGALKDNGYIITIEGDLHGATCCAVSAGWAAIQDAITRQCDPCIGTTLAVVSCPPSTAPACGIITSTTDGPGVPIDITADTAFGPWRTMFGVALVEAPKLVQSYGSRCPSCWCGPLTRARIVLRAQPGKFTTPETVATFPMLPPGTPAVAYVAPAPCSTVPDLIDPLNPSITPPPRPPAAGGTTSVSQVYVARSNFSVSTTNSVLFPTVGVMQLDSGSGDLRNVRLRWWRETPGKPASAYEQCDAWDGIAIPWLPAGHTITLDGRAGIASIQYPTGEVADGRSFVRSHTGAPWSGGLDLPPGSWRFEIEADPDRTPVDAELALATSVVEA